MWIEIERWWDRSGVCVCKGGEREKKTEKERTGNNEIILRMNPVDADKHSFFMLLDLVYYYFVEKFCIYFINNID